MQGNGHMEGGDGGEASPTTGARFVVVGHGFYQIKGQSPQRQQVGPDLGMGEAAKLLGVSRATLWRILQAGTIKKVELFHGSFRIRREDLERLAEGKFGTVAANGKDASLAVSSRLQKMLAAGARRRDPRFKELMALADGGDEGAAADLFKEFGFEYGAGKFTEKQTRRTDRTLATNGAEGGA